MRNRLGERCVELFASLDQFTHAAAGAGKAGKTRIDQAGLPDFKLGGLLFLGDFTQFGIVHQDVSDVHAVFDGRGEFHRILAEAAIARDRNNLAALIMPLFLRRRPGAHGRREREADGAEIA